MMTYTFSMARRIISLFFVLFALALAVSILVIRLIPAQERIYTLEEVSLGLRQDPQAWEGRTVLLRATLVGGASYRLCPVNPRTILAGHPPRCPDIGWIYLGPTTWRPNGGMFLDGGWTRHPLQTLSVFPSPSMPAQELPVQIHMRYLQRHEPSQPLPIVFYDIPFVGSLLPRSPSLADPVQIWSVRLLTPRACLALRQIACPDGVSLDY